MQHPVDLRYYNLIVTVSNLVGIFPLWRSTNIYEQYIIFLIIICSCLMHLSERKHYLPGIWPFKLYSNLFLRMDRIMSLIGIGVFTLLYYEKVFQLLYYCVIALMCLFLSEELHYGYKWF